MLTILGVNFGGGPEILEKQGRKIRYQNSPAKFTEKFAGNFPKIRQPKIKNSPQIRSAEGRDQHFPWKSKDENLPCGPKLLHL